MSFRFLVCVPLLFQVIIGLPLDSVNQIEVTSNVGLWDNSDLSIDQVVPGNLDGNFPLGNSGNAGYDIFASDGIGNQPQDSIFLNDVSLISADYTDKSPEFLLTEGNFLNDISETPGCTNQARKRDGDTPLQCAPGQKPNGQEPNGQKPDPGPSNEPIIPPFFVKPWTCPVGLHSMCCVGRIEDDKRAFGCSYYDQNRCTLFSQKFCCIGLDNPFADLEISVMGMVGGLDDPYGVGCIDPNL